MSSYGKYGRMFAFGLFIFLSFILSLLFPILAPAIGIVLFVSGVFIYRYNTDQPKYIAIIMAIAGSLIILTSILIFLKLLAVNSNTIAYEDILAT